MDVENEVEVLLAHVEHCLVAEDAGVVHQYVDAAVLVERGPDQAIGPLARGDAVVIRHRVAARRLDVGDGFLGHFPTAPAAMAIRAEVIDHNLRALLCEEERVLAADATACASNDRNLAVQNARHASSVE